MEKFIEEINELTLAQVEERLSKLDIEVREMKKVEEIDAATEQKKALLERKSELEKLETRKQAAIDLKLGKVEPDNVLERGGKIVEKQSEIEKRAKEFAATNRTSVNARSLLTSNSGIAKSTIVNGSVAESQEVKVSSLIDLITITDCTGMGTYRVPYNKSSMTAGSKTEGTAPSAQDGAFGYIDLTPNTYNVLSYVSKEIKKQTPLMYEQKTIEAARTALRKKASTSTIAAIYASELTTAKTYAKEAVNGQKIGEKTLRDIVFAFGGEEGVGAGTLILNKTDLIAFGDVRGTNEKKAVYEITPSAGNPNTGTIKDGGLTVNYIINKNCNAFSGCKDASANTMIYGDLKAAEMGLWGDFEISTSADYKFAEGLLSVLGECSLDVDVTVPNGFVIVKTGA